MEIPPLEPLPLGDSITIKDGCLHIGSKSFAVSVGGRGVTDSETLERVKNILESHPEGEIDTAAHKISPIKIFLKDESSDLKSYTDQIEALGYSREEIGAAINALFQESHLSLLSEDIRAEWGEKTLSDLLQESGNVGLQSALLELRDPATAEASSKCVHDLIVFILSNVQRNPKEMDSYRAAFFKGRDYSIDTPVTLDTVVERNKGLPSEADKDKYREEIENKNTNLGVVSKFDEHGGPERVIALRSGKSDSAGRVKELVVTAALSQLECSKPAGFSKQPSIDGLETYEFQHVIDSYLDSSFLKSIPERLLQVKWNDPSTWRNLWKTEEYEIKYLEKLIQSVEKWPPEGMKLIVEKKDGTKMCVILKRPIVSNQLLSTTLRGFGTGMFSFSDMGQRRSDTLNFISRQVFLDRYFKQQNMYDSLQEARGPLANFNPEKISTKILRDPQFSPDAKEFVQYQQTVAKLLLQQLKNNPDDLKARALFVCCYRRDPKDTKTIDRMVREINSGTFSLTPAPSDEVHGADCEIYFNLAMKLLNLSQSKQCKSGTDRTAIGIALTIAQDDFFVKFGKEYLPDQMTREEELYFKMKFHHALELARSMAVESKGYSGIKWGGGAPIAGGVGNPAPLKYLFNAEDIADIKKHSQKLRDFFQKEDYEFLINKKVDVLHITRSDLMNKGKVQYGGTLVDPIALLGKSEPSHIRKVEKAKEKLSPENRQKAAQEFNNFIRALTGDAAYFLNPDRLEIEFAGKITALHLEKKENMEELLSKIKELENKLADTHTKELVGLQLYMFKRLLYLWETVEKTGFTLTEIVE
ncbi:MAG: hypothetical protein JSR46_02600 [Verrucomicrobia bacterium]|nr:hypothetical protein [Verrucomicrobiota bacterium]